MNLPKIVRKSEDELAKIHMAESFVQRNSGLTSLAFSNGVHKLNNKFQKRDAEEFEAIEDAKSKKHVLQAKFFKKINDKNREKEKELFNIPKIIEKSKDELAKIHMVDRNSNSGLTNLAYSNGVQNLNDEFKKRDEKKHRKS